MKNRGFKTNSKAARAARLDFYSECVLGKLQSGVGGILFELRKTSTFSCLVSKSSKKKYRGIVVISATDRSGAGVWHVLRCRKGHVPLKDVLNKLLDISFMCVSTLPPIVAGLGCYLRPHTHNSRCELLLPRNRAFCIRACPS